MSMIRLDKSKSSDGALKMNSSYAYCKVYHSFEWKPRLVCAKRCGSPIVIFVTFAFIDMQLVRLAIGVLPSISLFVTREQRCS